MASSRGTGSRLSLCHQSSFSAENTLVTIVPSFSYTGSFPLISCTHHCSVGPFVAGMPSDVPLWVAKALEARNFCAIKIPDWLSVPFLSEILAEERTSVLLSTRLPFYYLEIARALDSCLRNNETSGGVGSSSSSSSSSASATRVVLQDLVAVRADKLRSHFHELSRSDLVHLPEGTGDDPGYERDENDENANGGAELPVISVTGICSCELNRVGPFLKRAFSDYGFLTRRPWRAEAGVGAGARAKNAPNGNGNGDGDEDRDKSKSIRNSNKSKNKNENNTDDNDYDDDDSEPKGDGPDSTSRRVSVARSRLRRFRD